MIRRISMWQLKSKKDANEMKTALLSMKGKVKYLSEIEVGINISTHKSAYDIVFIGTFTSREALEKFEVDIEHKKVSALVTKLRKNRVVIDYEF